MAVHRFSVNVPNPGSARTIASLRLEPVRRTALRALGYAAPDAQLKVESAGLTLDPCGTEGTKTLRLTLRPYSSVDVQVVIVTPAAARASGMAAFHLVDERAGYPAGGVTVACISGSGPEPAGAVVAAADPCPVTLASAPYPVDRDADPTQPLPTMTVRMGAEVDLVVPVINPTRSPLAGVQVYLEHLGRCDAQFVPITWNVGAMAPKQVFYATWPVHAAGWMTGAFEASVVVVSQRKESVRLTAPFRIGKAREAPARRRRRTG
jgi:hypothetical protein